MNEETSYLDGSETISQEMAETEFGRILSAARVKWSLYKKSIDARDAEFQKELIIDCIMNGVVTVNDDGFPSVNTKHDNNKLSRIAIFRRPQRADKLAMDRQKEGHMVAKEDAILGKFLNIAPSALQQLEERDYSVINTLWTVFLGY